MLWTPTSNLGRNASTAISGQKGTRTGNRNLWKSYTSKFKRKHVDAGCFFGNHSSIYPCAIEINRERVRIVAEKLPPGQVGEVLREMWPGWYPAGYHLFNPAPWRSLFPAYKAGGVLVRFGEDSWTESWVTLWSWPRRGGSHWLQSSVIMLPNMLSFWFLNPTPLALFW